MGYSAADIVQRIPKDSKSLEIQVILMESGIKCGRRDDVARDQEDRREKKWSWRNVLESIDKRLMHGGNWLEEMRGNLSMAATFIASITFQAALNPPGSVIQQGIRSSDPDFNVTSSYNTFLSQGPLGCLPYKGNHFVGALCPGKAMLAYRYPGYFARFIVYNTISFVASLCVALLLVSGVPLKHRFMIWMLSIGMGMALTCLLNAYFAGLVLIATPRTLRPYEVVSNAAMTFMGLYVLVGIYIAVKFVIWVVKKMNGTEHRKSRN